MYAIAAKSFKKENQIID